MAGKGQRKSSSIFNIFKACCSCSGRQEDGWEEPVYVRRTCTSDEDRGYWVAEPGIDRRASAFIAKFYESRASDPELQAVLV